MFKVKDDNTIHFTRGDRCIFELSIDGYTFQPDDVIAFRVYNKGRMDADPVIEKIEKVIEESDTIGIILESEDTKVGKIVNKPVGYWYEIELNGNQTVIGYDEQGPKLAIIYPEGMVIE